MCRIFHLLIVGSRGFNDPILMNRIIKNNLPEWCNTPDKLEIISGEAKGADSVSKALATKYKCKYKGFPANWKEFGKRAGPLRNNEMQEYISQFEDRLCLAFWDGESKGTYSNFKMAEKYKNPIKIIKYKEM